MITLTALAACTPDPEPPPIDRPADPPASARWWGVARDEKVGDGLDAAPAALGADPIVVGTGLGWFAEDNVVWRVAADTPSGPLREVAATRYGPYDHLLLSSPIVVPSGLTSNRPQLLLGAEHEGGDLPSLALGFDWQEQGVQTLQATVFRLLDSPPGHFLHRIADCGPLQCGGPRVLCAIVTSVDGPRSLVLFDDPDAESNVGAASYTFEETSSGSPADFVAADVDGDGCGELVVGSTVISGTDQLAVIRGFPEPDLQLPDGLPTDEELLAVGDLLPDPGDELVTGRSAPPRFSVLVAGPDGPPQPSGFTFATGADAQGEREVAVAVGDLDGDGVPDLALAVTGRRDRRDPGQVYLFRGPLDPTTHGPADADAVLTGPTAGDDEFGAALASADVDGDGRDDLLVGAPGDDEHAVDAGAASLYLGADLFP